MLLLLLTDVFENFWNMCHEIYELDPDRFLTTPGLAWQAAFKKNKVKLDLLTYTHMLSMAVKKGGIYHAIHRFAEA